MKVEYYSLLFLILLVLKESSSHSTQICSRVDPCTGELNLALGTYHSGVVVSGSLGSISLTSNSNLIPPQIIPIDNIAPSPTIGNNPVPAGFSQGDCNQCQSDNRDIQFHAFAFFTNLPPDTYTVDVINADANFDSGIGNGTPGCVPGPIIIGSPSTSFINCPSDVTISVDDTCTGTVNTPSPTCTVDTGLCPGFTCTVSDDPGNQSGNLPIGTYNNSWEILLNGVTNTGILCSQDITVEDNSPPSITCPSDVNSLGVDVTVPLPTVLDNCVGFTTISNDFNGNLDASDTYPEGNTVVVYTATDSSGNLSTCSFNVFVLVVVPIITCPDDIFVVANDCNTFVNVPLPDVVVYGPFTVSNDFNSGESASGVYNAGTTIVTYSATNDSGSESCNFKVHVCTGVADATITLTSKLIN